MSQMQQVTEATTPLSATDGEGSTGKPRPSGFRKLIASVLATAAIVLASLLTATPASAAGTAAPDLSFCFKQSNGLVYGNSPVHLYLANGAHVKAGKTNAAGCGTFVDVKANTGYYVRAYFSYWVGSAGYVWDGRTVSGWTGNAANTTYKLPTGTAYHYRIY